MVGGRGGGGESAGFGAGVGGRGGGGEVEEEVGAFFALGVRFAGPESAAAGWRGGAGG